MIAAPPALLSPSLAATPRRIMTFANPDSLAVLTQISSMLSPFSSLA